MVTHSSIYFGFLFQRIPTPRFRKGGCEGEDNVRSPLHHTFEKAALKGRIMSQYNESIKYIDVED